MARQTPPKHNKQSTQPPHTQRERRQQPEGDRRPAWWRLTASKLDLPGRLAERLEEGWQLWWVPLVLLSFPILLLLLAFVVTSLR